MEASVITERTFNTPLEAGLRSLFILATGTRGFDSQQLVFFDYFLVHSADLGGEESLHPTAPAQKGELLVRRRLVQDGLALMRSRDLVERRFLASGVSYRSTKAGRHVASLFDTPYANLLRERASWVVDTFGGMSERRLLEFVSENLGDWEEELIEDVQPQFGETPDA